MFAHIQPSLKKRNDRYCGKSENSIPTWSRSRSNSSSSRGGGNRRKRNASIATIIQTTRGIYPSLADGEEDFILLPQQQTKEEEVQSNDNNTSSTLPYWKDITIEELKDILFSHDDGSSTAADGGSGSNKQNLFATVYSINGKDHYV